MPSIKEIPIPLWMKKLPIDKRGYPVPYIAFIDDSDNPQFTISDEYKRQFVIRKDKCAICGNKLLRYRALVGGPASAFLEESAYLDPPMHPDCCRYALKVCPYLAAPSYIRRINDKKLDKANASGIAVLSDPTVDDDRPKVFVMVIYTKQKYVMGNHFGLTKNLVQYIKPRKPYIDVEYWVHGKSISKEEGLKLTKLVLTEKLMPEIIGEK